MQKTSPAFLHPLCNSRVPRFHLCYVSSKENRVASIEALPKVTDEKMEYSQAKDDADLYPAESESVDLESVTLHLHTDDQKQQRQHEPAQLHADEQPLLHANQQPELQQQAEEREEATPYLRCAKCTEQATVYCVDCSDKYCATHREVSVPHQLLQHIICTTSTAPLPAG